MIRVFPQGAIHEARLIVAREWKHQFGVICGVAIDNGEKARVRADGSSPCGVARQSLDQSDMAILYED